MLGAGENMMLVPGIKKRALNVPKMWKYGQPNGGDAEQLGQLLLLTTTMTMLTAVDQQGSPSSRMSLPASVMTFIRLSRLRNSPTDAQPSSLTPQAG